MRALFSLVLFSTAALAQTPAPSPSPSSSPAQLVPPARLAVICLGSDPQMTGTLQGEIEQRLSSATSVSLVLAPELAESFAGETLPEAALERLDTATAERAAAMFEEATYDFYKDRLIAAVEKLGALLTLQESDGRFPQEDRVRLRLWRATVYQALDAPDQAEREALAALSIAPELVVDTHEFAPKLAATVERIRGSMKMRLVQVEVDGLPPGALVAVDGRVVPVPFSVTAGFHQLSVAAPGFLTVRKTFEAFEGTRVAVSLPLAVPGETEAVLRAVVRGASATQETVDSLAATLPADWLAVVVVTADASRIALVHLGGNPVLASPSIHDGATGAPGELAAWLQNAVAKPPQGATPNQAFAGTFMAGYKQGRIDGGRGDLYAWNACGFAGGATVCLFPGSLGLAYFKREQAPPAPAGNVRSADWYRGYQEAYEKRHRKRRMGAVAIGAVAGFAFVGLLHATGVIRTSGDAEDPEAQASSASAVLRF